MKNYRGLMPVALIILMCLSIYSLVSGAVEQNNELNRVIKKANSCSKQGLYDKAVSYYSDAISVDNNVKYYLDIIDMYYDAKDYEEGIRWCMTTLDDFPNDVRVYERAINIFIKLEKFSDAYTYLDEANGKKLTSSKINQYSKEMEFLYFTESHVLEDVAESCSSYTGVKNNDKWGLASDLGSIKVSLKFEKIGYYCNDMVPVLDENMDWYFMNSEGEYLYNISHSINKSINSVGLYNEDVFPICIGKIYSYYDLKFEKVFDDYDFAGSFNEGIAAIKNGDEWKVIDNKGNPITKETYLDVIIDEKGICCKKGRMFVKTTDNEYIMIDKKGNRIGKESFEDAKLFGKDKIAAVKQDGLWGFIDSAGKMICEAKYDEAKSYSLGLAPVKKNNLWGYVDINNNLIIDCTFDDCYEFSNNGSAFVKEGESWRMIKLYKYNHE